MRIFDFGNHMNFRVFFVQKIKCICCHFEKKTFDWKLDKLLLDPWLSLFESLKRLKQSKLLKIAVNLTAKKSLERDSEDVFTIFFENLKFEFK